MVLMRRVSLQLLAALVLLLPAVAWLGQRVIKEMSLVTAGPAWPDSARPDLTAAARLATDDLEQVSVSCRYGVAALSPGNADMVAAFGAGWYLNFGANSFSAWPSNVEFVPVITVKQNKDAAGNYLPGYYTEPHESVLSDTIDALPGALWIIGNEVDRGPDPGQTQSPQGDVFPEVYAQAYHNLYQQIKQRDPGAHVAISALVQVTPGRLQYLDLVWQAYLDQYQTPMPVDVWNMHLYILPEAQPDGQPNGIANIALGTDPALAIRESGNDPALCGTGLVYCWADHDNLDLFIQQVVAMRSWMKAHGQQHKPLILSEYSILYPYILDPGGCFLSDEFGQCFTPERISNFATASTNYLEHQGIDPGLGYAADDYRLVQQWLWFSVYNLGVGESSNLVEADQTTLTLPGQTFQQQAQAEPLAANLLPTQVWAQPAFTGQDGLATTTLTAWVRNNGNLWTAPFTVTFYRDFALTQPIGSAVVEGARGCASREYVVTAEWDNLIPGRHYFWLKVDSQNVIVESKETDNVAQGVVLVDPHQIFAPLVRR